MEPIFDRSLVAARLARARRAAVPGADFLLRHVADDIAGRLAVVERQFERTAVVDDPADSLAPMLRASGKAGSVERVFLQTDDATHGEIVPIEPASINLAVSAMALHLTNDTPGVLVQIRRSLKPDGLFLAAVPGSGTLQELRESLLAAESELTGGATPRVAPFAEVRDYGALLQRAGFALPVADVDTLTIRYDTAFDLMRDLRAMGMTNPLVGRSRKPVRRAFFERVAEIYAERFSDPDGRIRATMTTIYISGWAPDESQQKPLRPGSAKARLADALNTREEKLKR